MTLDEYQQLASETDQNPMPTQRPSDGVVAKGELIPLLGMVGEVGTLLSEYKKLLRDGPTHIRFKDQVAEELGDVLWYVANVATKFGFSLGDIATQNIAKTRDRWSAAREYRLFDDLFPPREQLPREFEYTFAYVTDNGTTKVVLRDRNGEQVGDPLTDNARKEDGYRFHDVLHLANAAILGWSPVARRLLGCKRRSDRVYDEVEDGGRAAVIEEGIVASAYEYASRHDFLKGVGVLDWELLRSIKRIAGSAELEVKSRSAGDWEEAILRGFDVWRSVCEHDGGTVRGDLHARSLTFVPPEG